MPMQNVCGKENNMKKIVFYILIFALLISLCSCGVNGAPAKEVELQNLYDSFTPSLPDMLVLDDSMRLNLMGIKDEYCDQVICSVVGFSLQADEIWLIEAADEDSLATVKTLAENRLRAKMEEASFYSPDQYAICEDGRIITDGLYLAFIVSPEADIFEAAFKEAMK